ncbi:major facilitator superfamily domain-containing protein [Aspergillus keveii]|uniref:Major facilitator superfamily domain-containing protein n=1 Tax=Aspergillus keveii TaxID=714993 RepID=A0ABR4FNK2_9EURO
MSIQFNSTGTPHTLEANEKIQVTDPSTTQSVSIAHDESNLQEEGVGGAVDKRMSNLRWFVVCVGLYLTAFLYGLDSTIAADVQGPILASLGELCLLPWVGTGFLLGSVATVSLILTFEVGSAICGAAPNMQAMVVGRVVAGVGGSGVYLGGISYISSFVSVARRPIYTALISTYSGNVAVVSPRSKMSLHAYSFIFDRAFYINLVLGGVTAPIYIFCLPRHGTHRHERIIPRIKNLDWLGALLNAATYTLFTISCTYSGSTWPWNSGSIIALWVMTGVTILLFALQQWTAFLTTKEDRIYPVWCLRSRSLVLLYIATAGSSAVLQCNIYYIPLFFEFTKGDDAISVSARLLPFIFLMIFSSLFSGTLLPRFNIYAAWYLVSGIIAVVGSVFLFLISTGTPPRNIYGFEILTGVGCGLTFQAAYAIALSKSPPKQATAILGFINVAQLGGGALALAIAGAVFQNVGFDNLQTALGGRGYSAGEIREALGGGYSAILNDGSLEVRAIASDAIGNTIANVFGISIGGGAAVLGAGILMRWEGTKLS